MDDRPGQGLAGRWRWFGWLISVVTLIFIVRWLFQVESSTWASLRLLNAGWLIISVLIFQLWFLLRYIGWQAIIRRQGYGPGHSQNIRMWITSELLRYIPGNVWSFAGRYRGARQGGVARAGGVTALVLEALGLVSGAGLAACLLAGTTTFLTAGLLGTILLVTIGPPLMAKVAQRWARSGLATVTASDVLGLVTWYSLVWFVFALANVALFQAFGSSVTAGPGLMRLAWVSVASWLVGYLSFVTPMGLGVREVTFVGLVTPWLPVTLASVVSTVSRLWLVLSELVFLGLVWLVTKKP